MNLKYHKLHLGCGNIHIPMFINIDIVETPATDLVMDITNLSEIPDESIDLIYACHVLDYISRHKIADTLFEWNRVLIKNSTIEIAVSDFEKVCTMYQSGVKLERLWGHIVGGQKQPYYDQHGCVFDFDTLAYYLSRNGFHHIRRYNWRNTIHSNIDDYSQCYIPHMDKTNGILMSLNVEAKK